jgi:L-asparaginase / beta-aspartyl-peptidase
MHAEGAGPVAIAIHGGAGVIDRAHMTPGREASCRAGLSAALDAGFSILARGGSSLDAVTAAVRILEDDPQFNAGHGAVLSHDGSAELDAAIMDGSGPRAGSVAGIRHVKNPIELARLVMEQSPHVMLIGDGAEEFALERQVVLVPNSYFVTERRLRELHTAIASPAKATYRDIDAGVEGATSEAGAGGGVGVTLGHASGRDTGTVGAVAFDRNGNVAAATSTGGMTNKRRGRVGDSPIIGAGTYANNETCAVSATGSGEYFIRSVVAHDIHALVQYKHLSLEAAVHEVIQLKLGRLGGEGGVIAVDCAGNIVMDFNSQGMFRGARDSRGRREVAIY